MQNQFSNHHIGDGHLYFMELMHEYYLDAANRGSIARFVNHSCEPNSRLEKWTVGDETRVGLFTSKELKAGEEITFDYGWTDSADTKPQKCYCGTPR